MLVQISFTILFLLLPAAVLLLIEMHAPARKLGAIILCYGFGLILGNTGLIPIEAKDVQLALSEVCIALALPMLLFTLDIKAWFSMAGKAMLSLVFATMSVVLIAATLYFLLANEDSIQSSQLAAMSVGVYTGGTANLAAIKSGLDVPTDLYLLFHSLETLAGSIYLLAMLSVAIPFFRRFLPHPNVTTQIYVDPQEHSDASEVYNEDYSPLLKAKNVKELLKALSLSATVLAFSLGSAELLRLIFGFQSTTAITIMLLTSFGILLSLIPSVRSLTSAYKLGMYLIMVFCVVVASMADLKQMLEFNAIVATYLFATLFGSVVLHAILCKLANVDSDTFMVTSVSAVCSPPFVPLMVKSLNNPGVLLSGLTTGIIGFAIGNYLGISLALTLQKFI